MAGAQNHQEEGAESTGKGRRYWGSSLPAAVIVVVFFAFCGYYVFANWSDFAFVTEISFPETAAGALLILGSFLVNAYQLNLFFKKFGLSLGFVELFSLTMGMLLGNLLIPMRGGTGGLALYLKKAHGLDFQAFAAIYGGTALLIGLINAGLATASLLALIWIHGFVHPALSLLSLCLFAICLYLILFPPPVKWKDRGVLAPLFQAAHSWHLLTRDRTLLLLSAGSLLIISLALTLAFYFIYRALGTPMSMYGVLVTSSLGNIANLVPLTPGSLGVFDAVVIQVPQMFGMDPARSIAGALVFRVLCFFWSFLLGGPGLLYIASLKRKRE